MGEEAAKGLHGEERRKLAIPARLEKLHDVREFVDRETEAAAFDERTRYAIKLAVNEAVTNAIRHGSDSRDDEVRLTVTHLNGELQFCVADSGMFVHRFALPRELPERGRGLSFIAHLMDGLEVKPDFEGTTICFTKRRGPSS